ncbi:MAG: DUF4959 domain-containing protein, partial [Spirochaetales bacterium]|nr:DUF4959 domain-containing protein [Spirochaetales bacterium]
VNGKKYVFEIYAVSAAGIKSAVASSEHIPSKAVKPAPDAVTDLKAEAGNGQITLSWANPAEFAYVVVTYGKESKKVEDKSTALVITGLQNKTEYEFVVVAYNDEDTASDSASVKATPNGDSPSVVVRAEKDLTNEKPIVFTITFSEKVIGFTSNMLTIVNGTIDGEMGDNEDNSYTISINPNPDEIEVSVSVAADKVANEFGSMNLASNVKTVKYDSVNTLAVSDISSEINEAGSVNLSWTNPGEDFASCTVKYSAEDVSEVVVENITSGELSLTELDSTKEYTFEVYTVDKAGNVSVNAETVKCFPDLTAGAVVSRIAALPNPVTLVNEAEVSSIRTAYDNLANAEVQALVTNYSILEAAEAKIKELNGAADAVFNMIEALPVVADLKLSDEAAVLAAEEAFNNLKDPLQISQITNSGRIADSKTKIAELKQEVADFNTAVEAIVVENLTLADEALIVGYRATLTGFNGGQEDLVSDDATAKLADAEARIAKLQADLSEAKKVTLSSSQNFNVDTRNFTVEIAVVYPNTLADVDSKWQVDASLEIEGLAGETEIELFFGSHSLGKKSINNGTNMLSVLVGQTDLLKNHNGRSDVWKVVIAIDKLAGSAENVLLGISSVISDDDFETQQTLKSSDLSIDVVAARVKLTPASISGHIKYWVGVGSSVVAGGETKAIEEDNVIEIKKDVENSIRIALDDVTLDGSPVASAVGTISAGNVNYSADNSKLVPLYLTSVPSGAVEYYTAKGNGNVYSKYLVSTVNLAGTKTNMNESRAFTIDSDIDGVQFPFAYIYSDKDGKLWLVDGAKHSIAGVSRTLDQNRYTFDALAEVATGEPAGDYVMTGRLASERNLSITLRLVNPSEADIFRVAHKVILAKELADISEADETLVDAALAAYENATDKASLSADKTKLASFKTKIENMKAIAVAKDQAINAVSDYYSSLIEEDYYPLNWAYLTGVKDQSLEDIRSLSKVSDIISRKDQALYVMSLVTTIEQEISKEVSTFKKENQYILSKTVANITNGWIDVMCLSSALDAFGKLSTGAQERLSDEKQLLDDLTVRVREIALADAKTSAIAEVNEFGVEAEYSAENWIIIGTKKSAGVDAINDATDLAGVNATKASAIADLGTVKTKAQEIEIAQALTFSKSKVEFDLEAKTFTTTIAVDYPENIGSLSDSWKVDASLTLSGLSGSTEIAIFYNGLSVSKDSLSVENGEMFLSELMKVGVTTRPSINIDSNATWTVVIALDDLGDAESVSFAFASVMSCEADFSNTEELESANLTIDVADAKAQVADAQAQADANSFEAAHSVILGLSVDTVAIADKDAVVAAQSAFGELSAAAKAKLTNAIEAAFFTELLNKIVELEELAAAKTAAIADVDNFGNESDYSTANWALIGTKKTAGVNAINAATDIAGVNSTKASALADLETVKTTAQEQAQAEADTFKNTTASAALALDVASVTPELQTLVEQALVAYVALSELAKGKLGAEKSKLDSIDAAIKAYGRLGEWKFSLGGSSYSELLKPSYGNRSLAWTSGGHWHALTGDRAQHAKYPSYGMAVTKTNSEKLMLSLDLENDLSSYTLLFDIMINKEENSSNTRALYITNWDNPNGASDFSINASSSKAWFNGVESSFTFPESIWQRVVVVKDQTTVRVYVDGALSATYTGVTGSNIDKRGIHFFGGSDNNYIYVTTIALYQAALTEQQIENIGKTMPNSR